MKKKSVWDQVATVPSPIILCTTDRLRGRFLIGCSKYGKTVYRCKAQCTNLLKVCTGAIKMYFLTIPASVPISWAVVNSLLI